MNKSGSRGQNQDRFWFDLDRDRKKKKDDGFQVRINSSIRSTTAFVYLETDRPAGPSTARRQVLKILVASPSYTEKGKGIKSLRDLMGRRPFWHHPKNEL